MMSECELNAFERMQKAMEEMSEALARLQSVNADNSLAEATSLIESQGRSDAMLERLRVSLAPRSNA